MAKKKMIILSMILAASLLTACADSQPESNGTEAAGQNSSASAEKLQTDGQNILIAYFTRLDNTDGDIDTILQGGGPYGDIGDSVEDADVDALSSASIVVKDEEISGNTQAVAEMIQECIGGELFSIQTVQSYPADYNELIDFGEEENREAARPELETMVEGMEGYDVVFLGFPNWWYDMPMPVYSFLESYDFSGKTVIPFVTSAGSGFTDTIASIKDRIPDASIVENGLHIPMREVADSQPEVEAWLNELGFTEE